MNLEKIVKYFVSTIVIVIVLADIIFAMLGYTISEYFRDLENTRDLWILPFFGSIIVGHWWINLFKTITHVKLLYACLISLGVLAIVANVIMKIYIPWYMSIPGGLVVGALLWPQENKRESN